MTDLIEKIDTVLKLKESEKQALSSSSAAAIMAKLPLIADCENPERTALRHLLCVASAHRNGLFDAIPGEGLSRRMFDVSHFQGGDKIVLKYGETMLQMISLEDHNNDRNIDRRAGKYNPINSGEIDYYGENISLSHKLKKTWKKHPKKRKLFARIKKLFGEGGTGNWL